MEDIISVKFIVEALVFSFLGLGVLGIAFIIFDKLTPGNLWKEIFEEHNVALAIIMGAMALAISLIIAAAIQGS